MKKNYLIFVLIFSNNTLSGRTFHLLKSSASPIASSIDEEIKMIRYKTLKKIIIFTGYFWKPNSNKQPWLKYGKIWVFFKFTILQLLKKIKSGLIIMHYLNPVVTSFLFQDCECEWDPFFFKLTVGCVIRYESPTRMRL